MMNKKLIFSLGLLVFVNLLTFEEASAQSKIKIGCVDAERILNEVEEGKRAKATLDNLARQKQELLSKKNEELKKMREELESKRSAMTKDALEKKSKEYENMVLEFKRTEYLTYQELQAKEIELTKDILQRIKDYVEEVAKKEGYTLVLLKNALLYNVESIDLTEKIMKMYNERRK